MRLFVRKDRWENASRYYEVAYDKKTTELTLNLRHVGEDAEAELVCSKKVVLEPMFKKNNYFILKTRIFQGEIEFGNFFDMNNIARSRDELFAQMLLEKTDVYPDVVLYFHNTANEVAVFVNGDVKTSCDYELMDDRPAYLIAQEIYPELEKITSNWEVRRKMLLELDPNQSLAYMEAQLDVITKVIFLLLEQHPETKARLAADFPEMLAFENALQMNSLFTVKSFAKCLEEIQDTKKKVRELQKRYYAAKRDSA